MRSACVYCLALLLPIYGAFASKYDPGLLPFAPKKGVYVKVAYAQGLAAPNAKSTPIASFEVDINVDVNETVGLPTYKPHAPLTWQGTTELKTNILWTSLAGKPWKDTTFFFSTQPCDSPTVTAEPEIYPKSGGAAAFKWNLNVIDAGMPDTGVEKNFTFHFYRSHIADLDSLKCAVFVTGTPPAYEVAAQGPVTPKFPEIPNEFYTGVDVNIENKGYSYTIYEAYDKSCGEGRGAVLQGTYLPDKGHVRYLYDYKNNNIITLLRDQATPKGTCTVQPLDPKFPFVKAGEQGLVPAQHFLDLNPQSAYKSRRDLKYPDVRGVPVDTWEHNKTFAKGNTKKSLGVRYKFAIPSWHNGFQTGFRPLQQVELFGTQVGPDTQNSTKEVRHTYSFFDFQAHVPDSFSFEPCVLLPEGKGCECLYLKCGVDNTDGHRQVMREANPQVPTTANLTFAVDGDLPCATPAGYVTKKHHSSMVAAAFFGSFLSTALVAALIGWLLWRKKRKDAGSPTQEFFPATLGADSAGNLAGDDSTGDLSLPPPPRTKFKIRRKGKKEKRPVPSVTGPASVVDVDSFQEQ